MVQDNIKGLPGKDVKVAIGPSIENGFYYDVDPGWRGYYRDRNWYGHRWDYERIPNQRLQQNWKTWNNNRYWENQRNWGVQSYQPRPQQQRQELRQQRQQDQVSKLH